MTANELPWRVLVTGGCGFIGLPTVRRLCRNGHEVVVIDDLSTASPDAEDQLASMNATLVREDVTHGQAVQRILGTLRPQAVVHLAGIVSVQRSILEPQRSFEVNVGATEMLARECARMGVRRLVFASSAAVYGNAPGPSQEGDVLPAPLSPYALHKQLGEGIVGAWSAMSGMQTTVLRYFNVYGVGQHPDSPYSGVITRFAARLARRQPLEVVGDGLQTRDFVHVEDVASVNAIAAVGQLPAETYNVCTGTPTCILDLALLMSRGTGVSLAHVDPRAGEIRHSLGDSHRLSTALASWHPRPLSTGLVELTSLPPATID